MSIKTRERGDPLCMRMDDVCHRSVTLGEFLVDATWRFLIDDLTLEDYKEKIDQVTTETPGSLETNKGWDELQDYLKVCHHNENCQNFINKGHCRCWGTTLKGVLL